MNLFASMILQCLVRLVIYVDQMIVRHQIKNSENDELNQNQNNTHSSNQVWGIDNTVRNFSVIKCIQNSDDRVLLNFTSV